jgi:hypothetical protein
MPRNGSGVFTPISPDNPVVASTLITAVKFNNTMTDVATALTNSIAVNGESTVTGNIPMNGNKLTGLGAPTISGDALRQTAQTSFTPKIQDNSFSDGEGQTYTTQRGYYTKIGNTVFFVAIIKMSSVGTLASVIYLTNLPFAAADSGGFGDIYYPVTFSNASGLNITAGQCLCGGVEPGNSVISISLWNTAAGSTNLTPAELSNDGGFTVSGFYQVA